MMNKPLPALALVAALGVAACDNTDYEEQITGLQGQLETAQGEVSELENQLAEAQSGLGEMEQMRMELEEARARVQELENQPVAATSQTGEDAEALRAELEQSRARVAELEAGAPGGAVGGDAAAAAGAGVSAAALQQPLAGALSAIQEVDQQLIQLQDTLMGEGYEDLEIEQPRSRLRAAGESIAEAARAAGIDPQELD